MFWVIVTGTLGALLRFKLDQTLTSWLGSRLPWSTLIVNLLGCMAIGFLFGIKQQIPAISDQIELIIIGFLGAFTTYSTFSLQWVLMLEQIRIKKALLYIGMSVILGIATTWCGWILATVIT